MGSEMTKVAALVWILRNHGEHGIGSDDLEAAATTLSAQEEQIERLRGLLMEARNGMDEHFASTDEGIDLNCRIDAALEGSKRDG